MRIDSCDKVMHIEWRIVYCVFCWITNKNGERLLLLFVGWLNRLASVIFLSPTISLSRFHLDNHLSSSVFFHPSRHFPFKFTACLLHRSMTLLIDLIIIIFFEKKNIYLIDDNSWLRLFRDKKWLHIRLLKHIFVDEWQTGSRGLACLSNRCDEFRTGIDKAIRYAKALDCPR